MFAISKQRGVTLLEFILVMILASTIIFAGYRQYLVYRNDMDAQQLQANINGLFNALALYHKANCYGQLNAGNTPAFTPGTLNPMHEPTPTDPMPIKIEDDLITPHYLNTGLTNIFPTNPYVDNALGEHGYFVQFNEYSQPRYVCNTSTNGGATGITEAQHCDADAAAKTQIGTIIRWRPQVAIKIKNPNPQRNEALKLLLNADCLSDIKPGSDEQAVTIKKCSPIQDLNTGDYLVWERSPAFLNANTDDNLWRISPAVQQFNQMYTTYPITYTMNTNPTGSMPDDTSQYFLCGG